MYKFGGSSIFKFYSRTCLNHASVSRLQLSRCQEIEMLPRSWSADLKCGLSRSVVSNPRCYSTEKGPRMTAAGQPQNKINSDLYTFVEPHKEEDFVFLDFVEPVDNKDDVPDHLQLPEPTAKLKIHKKTKPDINRRGVEIQLNRLKESKVEEDSCIAFHDEGLQVHTKSKRIKKHQKIYGTPDVEMPVSDACCSGCGALMHCADPDMPGYLPSEKFKALTEEDKLKKAICQRCFLINHHQKALNITMSKEEYRAVVGRIRSEKALVMLIVDLLDVPDSIIPDLPELVGTNKRIMILGNKIDLLPGDAENYLQRIRRQLGAYCASVGISIKDPKDIHLISAKTGYGIENLISRLQSTWRYKGDVYLVGTANAGKSTLFNTLLESDYCKSRASDVIHKATISPWPGTTLNLLKFPIINPTPYRMHRRAERLKQASLLTEADMSPQELKRIKQFSKQGYLVGHIGRTFRTDQSHKQTLFEFDPDSLSFGEDPEEDNIQNVSQDATTDTELTYNEMKDAHWFYDTPGIMKECDPVERAGSEVGGTYSGHYTKNVCNEARYGLIFGSFGTHRLFGGENACWLTVVASSRVPVHITSLEKADAIYKKHAGNVLLAVPSGGEERMKEFPPLIPQDFELLGQGCDTAITDIKLSSAGWVAVTAAEGQLLLRTHAPEGAGLCLRTPPLLPHIVSLKGERIKKTPGYKTKQTQVLVDAGLSAKAAERLKVRTKKSNNKT